MILAKENVRTNLNAQFFCLCNYESLNLISFQKVESIPIFDSFLNCEVDPNGTNDNDIKPGSIATTRNARPRITPPS
jgi:hypothetical protein